MRTTAKIVDIDKIAGLQSEASEIDSAVDGKLHSSISGFMKQIKRETRSMSILVNSDSTGNDTNEWVYFFSEWLATEFPAYTVRFRGWDNDLNVYNSELVMNTGTGAYFIDVWNFAIAGGRPYNILGIDKKKNGFLDITNTSIYADVHNEVDLTIINHSHNVSGNYNEWEDALMYAEFTEELFQIHPFTSIMMLKQNPDRDDYNNEDNVHSAMMWANKRNFCVADVWEEFESRGKATELYADNIHPSTGLGNTGTQLFLDAVTKKLDKSKTIIEQYVPTSLLESSVRTVNSNPLIEKWIDTATPEEITISGGVMEQDFVEFIDDRKAHSLKLIADGGVACYAKVRLAGDALTQYLGKTLNVAVRFKPQVGGDVLSHGRVGIISNTKTTLNKAQFETNGAWVWRFSCVNVETTDSYVEARVYVNSSSSVVSGESINIDRIIISEGSTPKGSGY